MNAIGQHFISSGSIPVAIGHIRIGPSIFLVHRTAVLFPSDEASQLSSDGNNLHHCSVIKNYASQCTLFKCSTQFHFYHSCLLAFACFLLASILVPAGLLQLQCRFIYAPCCSSPPIDLAVLYLPVMCEKDSCLVASLALCLRKPGLSTAIVIL